MPCLLKEPARQRTNRESWGFERIDAQGTSRLITTHQTHSSSHRGIQYDPSHCSIPGVYPFSCKEAAAPTTLSSQRTCAAPDKNTNVQGIASHCSLNSQAHSTNVVRLLPFLEHLRIDAQDTTRQWLVMNVHMEIAMYLMNRNESCSSLGV